MGNKASLRRLTETRTSSGNSCTKKTIHQQPNWSDLPPELLELIVKTLTAVDIIHIKAVCTSWKHILQHYPLPQSPWLMLSSKYRKNSHRFFDVSGKATCYTMTNLFRGFSDSWCIGSSHGWLVILDQNGVMHLLNPLSGGRLQLPEIGTIITQIPNSNLSTIKNMRMLLCRHQISKVVLSSDPARNNNFTAAAVFKEKQNSLLAYCKKGYTTWIELYEHSKPYSDVPYSDVMFHDDDELFALGQHQDGISFFFVDVWNLKENPFVVNTIRLQDCRVFPVYQQLGRYVCGRFGIYLVECLGEILLIERAMWLTSRPHEKTVTFEVFKVNMTTSRLETVECLDHWVLFLDVNQSVLLSTDDFPGLKRNSIYFTDYRRPMMTRTVGKGEGRDIGVYSLEHGVVKPLDEIDKKRTNIDPPPFWILP